MPHEGNQINGSTFKKCKVYYVKRAAAFAEKPYSSIYVTKEFIFVSSILKGRVLFSKEEYHSERKEGAQVRVRSWTGRGSMTVRRWGACQ